MKVHSDSKRKPRYYVEHEGKVLFENDDASKVIQWAIDHAWQIELSGIMELKKPIDVTNGTVIEAEKEPSKE